jgi:uncharacterized membrane protein YvbJ
MDFCTECGSPLQQDSQFCNECGKETSQNGKLENQGVTRQEYEKAPMSKKNKKRLIAAGIGLAVLLGAYKTGEVLTDKDRLINNFETALNEKDSEEIADLLSSNDKKLEINKDSVKGFVKYIDENPEEVEEIVTLLRKQSEYEEYKAEEPKQFFDEFTEDYLEDNVVTLEKDGKFLFYDKYKLNVNSVYLTVETNYKDTTIYLNGKKLDKTKKPNYVKKFGPYLPGLYTLEAKLKTDFVDLVTKEKVSLVHMGKEAAASLYLEGEDVHLETNIDPDAGVRGKLLINGKDVGVNPFENPTFGPVLTDGSMTIAVEAQLPWGSVKTDEMKIDDSEIDIDLSHNKEFKKTLMNTVHTNTNEWIQAYTAGDTNKLTNVTEEYKQQITDDIAEAKEYDTYFKGKFLGSTFDLDSFEVYYEDGVWKSRFDVEEKYLSDFFYEDDSPQLEENSNYWSYELIYDKDYKKWLVNSSSEIYDLYSENLEVIEEKEPKQYVSSWATATASADGSSEFSDDDIETLISDYIYGLTSAINNNDYSAVSPYIKSGSTLDKSQQALVKSLNESGVTEDVVSFDVEDWSQNGDAITIKTYEEITVNNSDSSETKDYNWTYTAVYENGELLLTSIK